MLSPATFGGDMGQPGGAEAVSEDQGQDLEVLQPEGDELQAAISSAHAFERDLLEVPPAGSGGIDPWYRVGAPVGWEGAKVREARHALHC